MYIKELPTSVAIAYGASQFALFDSPCSDIRDNLLQNACNGSYLYHSAYRATLETSLTCILLPIAKLRPASIAIHHLSKIKEHSEVNFDSMACLISWFRLGCGDGRQPYKSIQTYLQDKTHPRDSLMPRRRIRHWGPTPSCDPPEASPTPSSYFRILHGRDHMSWSTWYTFISFCPVATVSDE